ncbi:MAG: PilW family protein [Rhodanobacteraceae bacterium]
MTRSRSLRTLSGFSLIELMVALALGVLVAGGIVSLFISVSKANQVQTHMARMQENARFVIQSITDNLRMVNAQYCSNTGGLAADGGFEYQDGLRTPTVMAVGLAFPDETTVWPGPVPTTPYPLPSREYLRGYTACAVGGCTPAAPAIVPAAGAGAGASVVGADVLTIRSLSSKGWGLGGSASFQTFTPAGDLTMITLIQGPNEPPVADFTPGDTALLADCSASQVIAVDDVGGVLTPKASDGNPGDNFLNAVPKAASPSTAARVFDFTTGFTTTTYFLELQPDLNPDARTPGHTVATLMRSVNGAPAQQVTQGIERLDFLYVVEDATGASYYLTAAEVDMNPGGITCPPAAPGTILPDTGCLWRAVKAIQVDMLVDSVDELPTLSNNELAYTYAPDGIKTPTPPPAGVQPNGTQRDLMRREFTALIAVRNYNP